MYIDENYLNYVHSECLLDSCTYTLTLYFNMSTFFADSEVSLLLHSIVFLSANYPNGPSHRRQEA